MTQAIKHLLSALGYGLLGSIVVLVGIYAYLLNSRPALKVWHQAELDAEFSLARASEVQDLDDYLRLENQLFEQLDESVYQRIAAEDRNDINRYFPGSRMDPRTFPRNWNRTFVLVPENPRGGVLLLHGLSDSPYSLRALGEHLFKQGFLVLGLRIPGHGTAPSGLLDVTWQDWSAAVDLAARNVSAVIGPQRPLYLFGYSNGAALAVEYVLSVLEGEDLPSPEGLVLLSPAIGVSKVAALAIWQSRLSWLTGLEKLAWNSIEPEFDPFKYNSFTVNAGDQIFQLTGSINNRLQALQDRDAMAAFPRVLAFISAVDATIPPATLIDVLFSRLPENGSELVLFDANHNEESALLLKAGLVRQVRDALDRAHLSPFGLTVIKNAETETRQLIARRWVVGHDGFVDTPIEISWPVGVIALSHLSIPFPPDDPLYGDIPAGDKRSRWIDIGSVAIKGERNLLQIPDNYFVRLRYNPFFSWLQQQIVAFVELGNEAGNPSLDTAQHQQQETR